jgi:hypothetical protein
MTEPAIMADQATLLRLIALGASFFPVAVSYDPDTRKCSKVPKIKNWQKSSSFSINSSEQLNGHTAYGFHPETIGAIMNLIFI